MRRALATLDVFAHFCRAAGLRRGRGRRRRHQRDPRRRERRGLPGAGARAHEPADPRAQPRAGGALRLPRGGQLDDAERRLRARPRRRLAAAGARRRSARPRARLLAAGHGAHDRALPARQRPRQAQADRGAARARRRASSSRPTWLPVPATPVAAPGRAWAGPCATSPPPPSARTGCRPTACRAMVVTREALEELVRAARGAAGRRAQLGARHQAGARRPDPRRRDRRAGRAASRRLRRPRGHRGGAARGRLLRAPARGRPAIAAAVRGPAPHERAEPGRPVPRPTLAHTDHVATLALGDVRRARAPRPARRAIRASANCCGRPACCTTSACPSTTTTTTSTPAT